MLRHRNPTAEFSQSLGPKRLDLLRGLPWEHVAARSAGEQLTLVDDRLVVPPPKEERVHQYIRREDVRKRGATEGCPACRCILEDKRTTLPRTKARRARITEAMEKDSRKKQHGSRQGQRHHSRRRDRRAREKRR